MTSPDGEPTAKTPKTASRSLVVAVVAILCALTAYTTTLIIYVPPPIGSFDASSVLILTVAILFGPAIATPVIALGEFIGTLYLTILYGYPPIFLPGIVAVRGLEAFIVASLRRKNEILALIVGPIWETIGFLIADIYLFGPAGFIVIFTLIDLIWVPVSIATISALRRAFNAKYLDDAFQLDSPRFTNRLLYPSLAVIGLSWILLLVAPVLGLL